MSAARAAARRIWGSSPAVTTAMVILVAGALGMAVQLTEALRSPDRRLVDTRFSIRPAQRPPANLELLTIDKQFAVLHSYTGQLARRSDIARAVTLLDQDGAKVIVLDFDFTTGSTRSDDEALATAMQQAGNVVYGFADVQKSGPHGGDFLMFGSQWGSSIAPRLNLTVGSNLNFEPIRSIPYAIRYGTAPPRVWPGLARVAVARLRGTAVPRSLFSGDAWIDYYGPPGSVPRVRFSDLLAGRAPRGAFAGKVVVVGADNPLLDRHVTSVSPHDSMAGAEVIANQIGTILRGFPLRSTSTVVDGLWILLLAAAFPLLTTRLRLWTAAVLMVPIIGGCAVIAQLAFDGGQVLPIGSSVVGLLGSAGMTVVGRYGRLAREQQRLRLLFAQMDPTTVSAVLSRSGEAPGIAPTSIVAGYRVDSLIAEGGMGAVYEATQIALQRSVALKLIRPEHAQDPKYRERFVRESLQAASIEHPNVIPIYEAGDAAGLLFIAMRYVEGLDLETRLRISGPMRLREAADVVGQLALGVQAAHATGLIHRDIKPANVLLTLDEPPHVYLTDFGVSRAQQATTLTEENGMVGSVAYMAPEQVTGETLTVAADVYALGGVLFTALTGRVPYERESSIATMFAHVNAAIPRASDHVRGVGPGVDDVLSRAMAKNVVDRFASAAAFAKALNSALHIAAPPK